MAVSYVTGSAAVGNIGGNVVLKPAATPDFLARAKAVWGATPPGKTLSAVVSEARGGES